MVHEQSTQPATTLPAATHIGEVHLRVADLEESLAFYRDTLGYQTEHLDDETVLLSTGAGDVNLVLHVLSEPEVLTWRTTGLYHVAILLPQRRDLALVTQRLVSRGWNIGGASDHGVSEALYLSDPDGNGIEIYVDRPRDQWPVAGSQVRMMTERLNFESLFAEVADGSPQWNGMPDGTTIGHIHLQVSDMDRSRRFYTTVLGFDVMQDTYPGALFVAAGGYHHHIGMNTWAGRGIPAPPANSVGLERFIVIVPDMAALEALSKRVDAAGAEVPEVADDALYVRDPDGIEIEFRVAS